MKSLLTAAVAAVMLIGVLPANAFAQGMMRGGYRYDTRTVQTVSGEVLSVEKVRYGRRGYYGVHLVLKTSEGEIAVHLGPSWFMERQALQIAAHDEIEVTGSRVTYEGKPALIAAEVKKGTETLRLRSESGLPLWRRGSR